MHVGSRLAQLVATFGFHATIKSFCRASQVHWPAQAHHRQLCASLVPAPTEMLGTLLSPHPSTVFVGTGACLSQSLDEGQFVVRQSARWFVGGAGALVVCNFVG